MHLPELEKNILRTFNLSEIQNLCFEMLIDYEELRGEIKSEKVQALLTYVQRRQLLEPLLDTLEELRPQTNWAAIYYLERTDDKAPFKGLSPFTEKDSHLFFGRQELTLKIIEAVQQNQFLAVVGPSGSGKSSLMAAGVLPQLKKVPQQAFYTITPGTHPLENLAIALTLQQPLTPTTTLMDDLLKDARSLHIYIAKQCQQHNYERFWLFIDQFEELFTQCEAEPERRAFIDNLVYAVTPAAAGPMTLLITLRDDFLHYGYQYHQLRPLLQQHQAYVGVMTPEELRQVIEEPAHQAGLTLESGLVDLMLREVGEEPGKLPFLSHALLETWRRRHHNMLTLQGYTATGGVVKAITQTAEQTFDELTVAQQQIAQHIFLRLTRLGQQGHNDTRRRATWSQLIPDKSQTKEISQVLNKMVAARLLIIGRNQAGDIVIDVAHEVLIQQWQRLQDWLEQSREALLIHTRLSEIVQEWQPDKDPSYLYRGSLLTSVEITLAQDDLSEAEQAFVQASVQLRQKEARRRLLLRTTVTSVAAFLLVYVGILIGNNISLSRWQPIYTRNNVWSLAYADNGAPTFYWGTKDVGLEVERDQLPTGEAAIEDGQGGPETTVRAIKDVVIDPLNPQRVFVHSAEHGVYYGVDETITWQALNTGLPTNDENQIDNLRDLDVHGDVIVGVVENHAPYLYIWQNSTTNWQPANQFACGAQEAPNQPPPDTIKTAHIASDGSTIYVGAKDGLYAYDLTTCQGWQPLEVGLPSIEFITNDLIDPTILYFVALNIREQHSQIYSWSPTGGKVLLTTINRTQLDKLAPHGDPTADTLLYALGRSQWTGRGRVFKVQRSLMVEELTTTPIGPTLDVLVAPRVFGKADNELIWDLLIAHEDGVFVYNEP